VIERPYIWTPKEFLNKRLSLGELGDIRDTSLEDAKKQLAAIATSKQLGHAGIALLGLRQKDVPESFILPEQGLIYPLFPHPEPEAEWRAFHDDFIHARVPGQLHMYDAETIALPI